MSDHNHNHDHDHHSHDEKPHHHEPEVTEGVQLVTCPVMPNNRVNPERAEAKGLYRDYNGRRYWFCCADCGPMWDAEPERYATAN